VRLECVGERKLTYRQTEGERKRKEVPSHIARHYTGTGHGE